MVEFSLIRLRRSFVFACTLLALLLAGGCQKKPQYNFRTATQSELDLKQSDIYPTVEDQARSPYIAFASTEFIGRLSRYHKTLSESFVLSALEEYSDLKVIEDQRVRGVLEFQEFQGFNRNSQQDLLRLGKRLQAEYVGLLRVTPSPVRASPNDWSTYIGLQVYRVNPPKLMLRDEFTFVFSESAQQLRGLRTNIPAQCAVAGPPLGTQLGQLGVNIANFVKDFNLRTSVFREGVPLPTRTTINADRSYNLVIHHPTATYFLKQAAGVQRGSMLSGAETSGMITRKHLYEIAKVKAQDPPMQQVELQEMCRLLIDSAHSIGIRVVDRIDPVEYQHFLQERKAVVAQQKQDLQDAKEAKLLRTAG